MIIDRIRRAEVAAQRLETCVLAAQRDILDRLAQECGEDDDGEIRADWAYVEEHLAPLKARKTQAARRLWQRIELRPQPLPSYLCRRIVQLAESLVAPIKEQAAWRHMQSAMEAAEGLSQAFDAARAAVDQHRQAVLDAQYPDARLWGLRNRVISDLTRAFMEYAPGCWNNREAAMRAVEDWMRESGLSQALDDLRMKIEAIYQRRRENARAAVWPLCEAAGYGPDDQVTVDAGRDWGFRLVAQEDLIPARDGVWMRHHRGVTHAVILPKGTPATHGSNWALDRSGRPVHAMMAARTLDALRGYPSA